MGLIHHGRAYERFTGNQIARFAKNHPAEYEDTERISLVSSFVTSLLRGDFAPIDFSDGCGMNLLNIHTRRWYWSLFVLIRRDARCLDACAPGLEERLGDPVPSWTTFGCVCPFFQEWGRVAGVSRRRFGLSASCEVVCGSGDNPCSLVGLRLCSEGDIAVSMGTSNTVGACASHSA